MGPHIGGEHQLLAVAVGDALHVGGDKGGVIHLDAQLFHRRDQKISVAFAQQNGGEQLDHALALNRRFLVIPGAVAGDAHIDIVLTLRLPFVHRGQPLFVLVGFFQQRQ